MPDWRAMLCAKGLAFACVCLGIIVLTGWGTGIEAFKRILPDYVAMVPTTALCFLLVGLGLLSTLSKPNGRTVASGLLLGASAGSVALGHVDKWRSHSRIEVMSMKPRKLSAVLSYRVATRRAFFSLLKQRSTRLRSL